MVVSSTGKSMVRFLAIALIALSLCLLAAACDRSAKNSPVPGAPAEAKNAFVAQPKSPGIYEGKTRVSTNSVKEGVPELIIDAFPK
jgi:hypothetical protein